MAAGSKMGPPLGKASQHPQYGITWIRREKKMQCSNNWGQRREESGYVRGTALQAPGSVEKEEQQLLQLPEQIPLQPMETMVSAPAAQGGQWGCRDPPVARGWPPHQNRWMSGGGCHPKGSLDWRRHLVGPWPLGERRHAGSGLGRACDSTENPRCS